MFPVTDFNVVVCGLATFAATVGYTYARKLTMSTPAAARSTTPSPVAASFTHITSQSEAPQRSELVFTSPANQLATVQEAPSTIAAPSRRASLKRKIPHDGFDDATPDLGYPHNLANIYPKKRCRTPSTEAEETQQNTVANATSEKPQSVIADEDVIVPHVSEEPEQAPMPIIQEVQTIEVPPVEGQIQPELVPDATPVTIVSQLPEEQKETPAAPLVQVNVHPTVVTPPSPPRTPPPEPKPQVAPAPATFTVLPSSSRPPAFPVFAPLTPRVTTPIASATRGFAAFASSSSPFATVRQQGSSSPAKKSWTHDGASVFGSPSGTALSTKKEEAASSSAAAEKEDANDKDHAIAAAVVSATQTVTHVTGEEDENVELELKNVKMYVKRGEKPFSDGILGHVKVLENRTTLDERILFRREPLWKVTMNVRIQPTVRCVFDVDENVLRLVLKEQAEKVDVPQSEIVIYALKPGRGCSKQDFKDFAQTLTRSAHFKRKTT